MKSTLSEDLIKFPMGAMETQDKSVEGMGIALPVPSTSSPDNNGDNPSIPDASSLFGKGPSVRVNYQSPKSGDPYAGMGKF